MTLAMRSPSWALASGFFAGARFAGGLRAGWILISVVFHGRLIAEAAETLRNDLRHARDASSRETRDPWERAFAEARAAAARGEAPIGACVVKDGEILASAGNRTIADHDPTAHAEMLAIRRPRAKISATSG